MSGNPPTSLRPIDVHPRDELFRLICDWPFADSYVARILTSDIPLRMLYGLGHIWAYQNIEREIVGFGTIDYCDDYTSITAGKDHVYIPLLAVHPAMQRRGYGQSIVNHLFDQSVIAAVDLKDHCHDAVLLDVYASNQGAIALYEKCDFVKLTGELMDDIEKQSYFVMGRSLRISG